MSSYSIYGVQYLVNMKVLHLMFKSEHENTIKNYARVLCSN